MSTSSFEQQATAHAHQDLLALIRLTDALNVLHKLVDYSAVDGKYTQQKDLLPRALTLLIEHSFFKYCFIAKQTEDQEIDILASASIDRVMAVNTKEDQKEDLLQMLLKASETQLHACFQQSKEYHSQFKITSDAHTGDGSFMAVPFNIAVTNRHEIAYLVVLSDKETPFDQWHVRILNTFTKVLSALFIAHHIQQQQHEKIRLKTRLLEYSRQCSEETSQAKIKFLSHISHQIRAPMNSVFSLSQSLMQDKRLNGEQRRSIHSIFEECSQQLNILNDTVNINNVDNTDRSPHIRLFELQPLLDEVGRLYELRLTHHQIEFECINHCPDELVIKNDLDKLHQLLITLFDYALHHAQHKISLHVLCTSFENGSKEATQDEVLFKLSYECKQPDTLNNHHKIHHLFDAPSTTQTASSPLHLAQKYSQSLEAKLWLDIDELPNHCFRLCLPNLRYVKQNQKTSGDRQPLTPALEAPFNKIPFNVLVVDDVAVNRVMLGRLLLNIGAHVLEASDGLQAIDILNTHPVDIIFMDIKMPLMDGDEALLYIRQHISKTLPCIAVTAKEVQQNTDQFRLSEFNQVICKPFTFDQIFQSLRHYIH